MECFSIDESGYTGYDLLNPVQRFQGATALCISSEEAAALITKHFPRLQAPELKYSSLARRASYRGRLLTLQKDVLSNHKCVTMVCDKRFLLILMFLDYATEPFYFERGVNFYQDGQNFALASLLYYAGPALLGKAEWEATLVAFQLAVKEKTPAALQDLVDAVRRTNWRELPEALAPMAHAAPACLEAIRVPGVSTDAAYLILQAIISRLEVMADGPYRVEHDRSDNLLQYHDVLERLIAHDRPVTFKQTELTTLSFPLKLKAAAQVDSKDSPAVQLADVLVGAMMAAANEMAASPGEGTRALLEVVSQYANEQLIFMTPSQNLQEEKRFRQGGQGNELIDYFATHFAK